MSIDVRVRSPQAGNLDKLLREWPKRLEHVKAQLTYLATEYVHEEIQSRIPNDQEYGSYRRGLTFSRVMGTGKDVVYAVHINPKSTKVRKIEAKNTLLYVKAKRRSRRTPPEIAVLERYNPWTVRTLPFAPNKRWAIVVSQKANPTTVAKVEAKRQHQRPEWRRALTEVGVRTIKKDQGIKLSKKLEALPDVALDGIRLEFGLGNRAEPHWRPAILGLRKTFFRRLLRTRRGKELIAALTNSRFKKWTKWPKRMRGKLRAGEAKKFVGFQKRLGIRGQK
jgi:hypothetical protein